VHVESEPVVVSACHCDFCQKRTGSAFGIQAYFPDDGRITVVGETTRYNGLETDGVGAVTGVDASYYFCPTCGSTVFWTFREPSIVGVAIGNFVEPSFPMPSIETSTGSRHHWIPSIPSAEQFESFPAPEEPEAPG
jgi:hypothetical protein